jgi:hypothetical protein
MVENGASITQSARRAKPTDPATRKAHTMSDMLVIQAATCFIRASS